MARKKPTRYRFTIRSRKLEVIADKVLFFRMLQNLHGRFWGLAAAWGACIGMGICFLIRPDMRHLSTAFSDFGNDVRTAPFFSGTMFFTAYGLWRWRNYLSRTLKRSGPIMLLLTLTIIGLYLVALMPVSWRPLPYKIHIFGVVLAGGSMVLTVIVDGLLTKTKKGTNALQHRTVRALSVGSIIIGGYITYRSTDLVHTLQLSLLGELLILMGYILWIIMKTSQGEGAESRLSKLVQKIIIIK